MVCTTEGLVENEIKGRKELSIPYAMEFKLSGNLQRTKWSSITSYHASGLFGRMVVSERDLEFSR